jgi:hypothetical protein
MSRPRQSERRYRIRPINRRFCEHFENVIMHRGPLAAARHARLIEQVKALIARYCPDPDPATDEADKVRDAEDALVLAWGLDCPDEDHCGREPYSSDQMIASYITSQIDAAGQRPSLYDRKYHVGLYFVADILRKKSNRTMH